SRAPRCAPLFPYTTLFRSFDGLPGPIKTAVGAILLGVLALKRLAKVIKALSGVGKILGGLGRALGGLFLGKGIGKGAARGGRAAGTAFVAGARSEEHTSELQSRENLVCRLL